MWLFRFCKNIKYRLARWKAFRNIEEVVTTSAMFVRAQKDRAMGRIRIGLIRLLIWMLLLYLGAIPAYAQTAQEIARKAFASTVFLVLEDANGQPLSLGSGFFVRDHEVASNLHVVEGAARGYAN
jgi:S1-C subfamily serine protease